VAVGSYRRDVGGADSGSVFTFARKAGSWEQTHEIVAQDAKPGEMFGWSLGLSGERLVVGAWYDSLGGAPEGPPGSAYVMVLSDNEWVLEGKLVSPGRGALDLFGFAVAVSGETVVVGARFDDDVAHEAGAVYVR